MCRKYIEMQTLADEKCFNKNNNNDVQLIYGQWYVILVWKCYSTSKIMFTTYLVDNATCLLNE